MVLTEQEKKVLLERLKAGREKKKAEREAAKKTPSATAVAKPHAETPAAEPAVEPKIEPAVLHAAEKPIEPPAVEQTKVRKPKKVDTSSDSDSDVEEDNKPKAAKNKKKSTPYMKIKIYQEPKNPAALHALVGSLQEEEPAPPVERATSPPKRVTNVIPKQKLSAPIVRANTMRSLAMDIFG
jgi:membrane protein involved in colicin uptake